MVKTRIDEDKEEQQKKIRRGKRSIMVRNSDTEEDE
jgi:hypothetical protein